MNLRNSGLVAEDQALRSVSAEMARILTETDPKKLQRIMADLDAGGDFVNVMKSQAPDVLNKLIPYLAEGATRGTLVGNLSGSMAGELNPTLFNQDQQALMQ